MWQDLQGQVKRLMESTLVNSRELAHHLSEQMACKVHPAEISHAVNDERGATRKGRQILILSLQRLTEVQERQNEELRESMRRAEKALNGVNAF